MLYSEELTKAMTRLGEREDTIFLGQQMLYPGNALFSTLQGVPVSKRVELGVAEDMQLGIAIGLALGHKLPIAVYPRMDFLMCAMNQLVNHLDKMPVKVIIRTCVGSREPLDPGPQHTGDYCHGLQEMLKTIPIYRATTPEAVHTVYDYALADSGSSIVVEYGSLYGME